MFKRVLLCHDGSDAGRRALKRGAELAILLRADVHVLLVAPSADVDPVIAAGAAGHVCILDAAQTGHEAILARSIQWLTERGVRAEGHLAHGNSIDQICEYARRLMIDLIVLGHYPQPKGGFWWSGPQRKSLAERVNCCVFVAMDPEEGAPKPPG
jgi:nucleotide-binding universal stress UspA family protein